MIPHSLIRKQNLMMARARPGADPVKARAADPEYVQVESFLGAISQGPYSIEIIML